MATPNCKVKVAIFISKNKKYEIMLFENGTIHGKRVPMYKIYNAVKDYTGITKVLLQKKIQTKHISIVRSATYLLFRHFGYTVEEIGRSIKRDHSTVTHGSNNICMSGLKLFTELRDIIVDQYIPSKQNISNN